MCTYCAEPGKQRFPSGKACLHKFGQSLTLLISPSSVGMATTFLCARFLQKKKLQQQHHHNNNNNKGRLLDEDEGGGTVASSALVLGEEGGSGAVEPPPPPMVYSIRSGDNRIGSFILHKAEFCAGDIVLGNFDFSEASTRCLQVREREAPS